MDTGENGGGGDSGAIPIEVPLPAIVSVNVAGRVVEEGDGFIGVVDVLFNTGQSLTMLTPNAIAFATQVIVGAEQMRSQASMVKVLHGLGYDRERITLILEGLAAEIPGIEIQDSSEVSKLDIVRGPVDSSKLTRPSE